jgi:hypothetical protein
MVNFLVNAAEYSDWNFKEGIAHKLRNCVYPRKGNKILIVSKNLTWLIEKGDPRFQNT